MTDFPDWQDGTGTAVAIANANLSGTGLAKETGGNLDVINTKTASTGHTVASELAGTSLTGTGLSKETGGNLDVINAKVAATGHTISSDLAGTNLTGTGLSKETGGNLDTINAKVAAPGKTVATEIAVTSLTGTGLVKESGGNIALINGKVAQTGSTIAGDISVTGAPLLRLPSTIAHGLSVGLAGGASATLANAVAVTQLGLDITLFLQSLAVAATPFVSITLQWNDATSGLSVATDVCVMSVGLSNNAVIHIEAPARSSTVTVILKNLDGATIVTYSYAVNQASRDISGLRMEEVTIGAVGGFTRPGGDPQSGVLASTAPSINALATQSRLAAAWSGPAWLAVDNNTANALRVVLADPSALYGTAGTGAIAAFTLAANTSNTFEVNLPVGPVLVSMTNTGAAGTITPTVTLTRKESYV